jgi:long-chain acyl-CoA synthetase
MIEMTLSATARRIRRIALGDLVHRTARKFGARTAVIDGDIKLSYTDLDERSSQCAHYLLEILSCGRQVAMLCANSADMLVAMNGIHKSGNIWVPVNIMLGAAEIGYILRHAEASCIVADEAICGQPAIAALLRELALPVIVTLCSGGGTTDGTALATLLHGRSTTMPEVDIDGEGPALIMYTSGTTGHPKGVVHSHASVYSAVMSNSATFTFTERDVVSGVLPLFHCAQHAVAAAAISAGACMVLVRGFVPRNVINTIAQEKITVMVALPMMYGALLADSGNPPADFSSVRECIYGMAPMPRQLVNAIAQKISPHIMLATGQTEIYPVTMTFQPIENPERDANYWGFSTVVCETSIMDDEGRLLAPGEAGEIVHRGPNVMLGYFKDPEATAVAQKYGWHHTGDLGLIDNGGQLLFLDRKKDMVKTGGENVASIKVESAILTHPAVAGVAVVGLPHPHWGEAVSAFVVLKPGTACDEAVILQHCSSRMAKFEIPKMVRFVDALPSTATGKIQKNVLRKQYDTFWRSE